MQVVTPEVIKDKRVILRYDFDVPLEDGVIVDDFRLKAGLETLELCLEGAAQVTLIGHLGRPNGEDPKLTVEPIYHWLLIHGFEKYLESGQLQLLENLRFEEGEDNADLDYSRELALYGEIYVNEAFAAHHPAASTTVLPTLMPHFAGLRFAAEVDTLLNLREHPTQPLVVIIGGAKIEDKTAMISQMSEIAKNVLVGGKLPEEIKREGMEVAANVMIAKLTDDGLDIAQLSIDEWKPVILEAKTILWNGPLGLIEDPKNEGTAAIAQIVLKSGAQTFIGGGDTVSALHKWGLIDRFTFISTGGGAMLKLLADGTLPTIEVLK